jgi:hypothetical protein
MGMVGDQADIASMRNFCEKRVTALLQLGKYAGEAENQKKLSGMTRTSP